MSSRTATLFLLLACLASAACSERGSGNRVINPQFQSTATFQNTALRDALSGHTFSVRDFRVDGLVRTSGIMSFRTDGTVAYAFEPNRLRGRENHGFNEPTLSEGTWTLEGDSVCIRMAGRRDCYTARPSAATERLYDLTSTSRPTQRWSTLQELA